MILLIFLLFLWGTLHSLLASVRVKEMVRKVIGSQGMRFYRLVYNLLAGLSLLLVMLFSTQLPDRRLYQVPLPWSIIMVLGEGLAMIVLLVGFLQSRPMEFLGICQLGSPIEEPGYLHVDGLYRFIRHPLYTAGLVLVWLVPVMTMNILVINIALTIYIVIGAYLEEGKLQGEFGQEYVDYMAVTPMFIPFLKWNK
jgi:methanethiol S-methyltransferase